MFESSVLALLLLAGLWLAQRGLFPKSQPVKLGITGPRPASRCQACPGCSASDAQHCDAPR